MPRVSQQQTDKNRIAIEDASSRLFREKGLNGVSVADLMAAAGLTHGGFYGHFASKDGLAAVACGKAFEQSTSRWAQRFAALPDAAARRRSYVENYLSPSNRDRPGNGCPAAGLAGDVAREPMDRPVRAAYLDGLKGMVRRVTSIAPDARDADEVRPLALVEMATLVGALVLARATRGDPLSDEILQSVRTHLLADLAPHEGLPS